MDRPQSEIDGCQIAHRRLWAVMGRLADDEFGLPSALPGWSVGHVLTHLARNAEAMCRRIQGAIELEVVDQYAGGPAGRTEEIENGARRDPTAIRNDVVEWSSKLDALFASIPDEIWSRPVRTVSGGEHPVASLPFRRWREVEVHLVDLGRDVRPADWPDQLVVRALPRLVAGLTDRADQRELMAWLLGRGPAPELEPWADRQKTRSHSSPPDLRAVVDKRRPSGRHGIELRVKGPMRGRRGRNPHQASVADRAPVWSGRGNASRESTYALRPPSSPTTRSATSMRVATDSPDHSSESSCATSMISLMDRMPRAAAAASSPRRPSAT